MAMANERSADDASIPLVVRRVFAAPRELVFAAWSSAEHLQRWFCPAGFSVPEAEVEFRVGGAFNLCMRSPQGEEHWTRGRYLEIVAPSRLVIDMSVSTDRGPQAATLFDAYTAVSLTEQNGGGTLLEVVQRYTLHDPAATRMIQGATQGWSETLNRLEQEVAQTSRLQHSVAHATFRIERTYAATPAQVYHALTDPVAKAQWFAGGEGFTELARSMDVRAGGRERLQGRWQRGAHPSPSGASEPTEGVVTTFDAVYLDVVPQKRLVYAYEMHLDDRKISVSLATLELESLGAARTRLTVTEQGAFLDGYEDGGSRERGTGQLLDALGRSLATG